MIFILGIERSATTWISNILEAHPATELYMEPLSIYKSRFKEWPDRFKKIDDLSHMAQYFRDEFSILRTSKRLFFSRLFDKDRAWDIDFEIADFLRKKVSVNYINDFLELNFHRRGERYNSIKQKKKIEVIKELRLNYNAKLINKIYPDARIIIVVRDAASTIQSIIRNMEQGSLIELKLLLLKRFKSITIDNIFEYWQSSYNALLKELDEAEADYYLLTQEELIKNAEKTIQQLFEFIELKPVPSVYDYIKASGNEGGGIHHTHREHKALLDKNEKARNELYPLLKKQAEKIDWHPCLLEDNLICDTTGGS